MCPPRESNFHPLTRPPYLRRLAIRSTAGNGVVPATTLARPPNTPGIIEKVSDLNGDGRPKAVVTEGGTYCYDNTGAGYSLVSKQANGKWKLIRSGTGIPNFLTTKGVGGWPDIEIGGPGFCFPVERWNGHEYILHRHQYENKSCQPN